jgi:MoaA/NifB/PqqE/SkfB family radical SAM enzyme
MEFHRGIMLSDLIRYYRAARTFRFFYRHPYIYWPIGRDLIRKAAGNSTFERPRNIVLKLTSQCNARCRFCYAQKDSKSLAEEMRYEEWTALILAAKKLGCYTVTLSGGEPLLYPRLLDLVRFIRKAGMLVFTTTNGLAADPATLLELEKAGLCALNFSVHGPRDQHDFIVGKSGAFDRILANGEFCARKTSIVCLVNHVLTKASLKNSWYEHVWEVMRLRGFRALNLLPVCASSVDTSDLLDPEELQTLDDLASRPDVMMDTKNYATPACPAARDDLFISDSGEVQPCPFIPISFGNVRDGDLQEIFVKMQNHSMFASRSPVCMPARDAAFIDRFILPAFRSGILPVGIDRLGQS